MCGCCIHVIAVTYHGMLCVVLLHSLICKACVTIFLFFTIPQALPDEKQRELVSRELWVDANVVQYVAEQEDEMKTKMATSSKYKMYRSVVEVDRQPRSQALPPSAK